MNFHNDQSAIVHYSLHSVALGIIHILRQQKDWVGGSRKCTVLLTFSTVCKYADIVQGSSEKVQNYADVIYGCSLMDFYDTA